MVKFKGKKVLDEKVIFRVEKLIIEQIKGRLHVGE